MPPRAPELQMIYDEDRIPVSAKCYLCGEQMPQSTPRITNPIDNIAWFAAQFKLLVAQSHLHVWTGKSRVQVEATDFRERQGISLDQFVTLAVAEKLATIPKPGLRNAVLRRPRRPKAVRKSAGS